MLMGKVAEYMERMNDKQKPREAHMEKGKLWELNMALYGLDDAAFSSFSNAKTYCSSYSVNSCYMIWLSFINMTRTANWKDASLCTWITLFTREQRSSDKLSYKN